MPEPRIAFSVHTAAEACSLSPDTIRRAIRTGALRAKRTSKGAGNYVIRRDDLEQWLSELPDG